LLKRIKNDWMSTSPRTFLRKAIDESGDFVRRPSIDLDVVKLPWFLINLDKITLFAEDRFPNKVQ
jgi:hypothetical protein